MSCVAPCLRSSRCSGSTLAGAADSSALLRSMKRLVLGTGIGMGMGIGAGGGRGEVEGGRWWEEEERW